MKYTSHIVVICLCASGTAWAEEEHGYAMLHAEVTLTLWDAHDHDGHAHAPQLEVLPHAAVAFDEHGVLAGGGLTLVRGNRGEAQVTAGYDLIRHKPVATLGFHAGTTWHLGVHLSYMPPREAHMAVDLGGQLGNSVALLGAHWEREYAADHTIDRVGPAIFIRLGEHHVGMIAPVAVMERHTSETLPEEEEPAAAIGWAVAGAIHVHF